MIDDSLPAPTPSPQPQHARRNRGLIDKDQSVTLFRSTNHAAPRGPVDPLPLHVGAQLLRGVDAFF